MNLQDLLFDGTRPDKFGSVEIAQLARMAEAYPLTAEKPREAKTEPNFDEAVKRAPVFPRKASNRGTSLVLLTLFMIAFLAAGLGMALMGGR